MPTHAPNRSLSPPDLEIAQGNVACPAPLTPPSEGGAEGYTRHPIAQRVPHGDDGEARRPVSDNTAAGMALMQEETMYLAPQTVDEKMCIDTGDRLSPEVEEDDGVATIGDHIGVDPEMRTERSADTNLLVDAAESRKGRHTLATQVSPDEMDCDENESETGLLSPPLSCSPDDRTTMHEASRAKPGIPSIDQELDWSDTNVKDWDFSHRRLRPQYPSATFQPYSKFKGTQQSDRQIYNVEVTILTVDIAQSSMSGYLQICGLTPDHPTLTTFFTGEIIGGPDQKYSFRTRDPAWGASDKTDLTHWARFPAWRPLSLHAKRNINFVYPMNHEDWWQQEYIFMRWKEHFLVPDYKLKSIQGASFEGFYYICFNQIEGRVSGIYFHSKSEK